MRFDLRLDSDPHRLPLAFVTLGWQIHLAVVRRRRISREALSFCAVECAIDGIKVRAWDGGVEIQECMLQKVRIATHHCLEMAAGQSTDGR